MNDIGSKEKREELIILSYYNLLGLIITYYNVL